MLVFQSISIYFCCTCLLLLHVHTSALINDHTCKWQLDNMLGRNSRAVFKFVTRKKINLVIADSSSADSSIVDRVCMNE